MFHVKHFLYHGRGCAKKKEVFHVKHLLLSEISLCMLFAEIHNFSNPV